MTLSAVSTALLVAIIAGRLGADAGAAAADTAAGNSSVKAPPPPQLPANFVAKGRWIVRDLNIDVPFTWEGNAGNSQMIAGGEQYPIYFTNIISGGTLYTLTYKWPGIARRPCSRIGPFTLADLNNFLKNARFVGTETLERKTPRRVHHFRVGVVWAPPPEVLPPGLITPVGGSPPGGEGAPTLRLPLMQGDFYVDAKDPTTVWQVLHFGLQNLYDPEQDEWAVLDSFAHKAGTVTLPAECTAPAPSATP